MRFKRSAHVLFAILSIVIFSPIAIADCGQNSWCCETYRDVTIINIVGYGDVCGGRGYGCTECYDTGSGDSCITDGTYCSPRHPENPTP